MANSKGDNETVWQKIYKEVCVMGQIHKEINEYYFENPAVEPIRPMKNTKSWKIESKVIVSIEQKHVKPGPCKTKIPVPRHEDLSKCVPRQKRDKIRGPRQEDCVNLEKPVVRKTHSRIPILIFKEDSKHSVIHYLRKTENKYQEPRLEHHAKPEKFSLPRADNKMPLTPGKYHAKSPRSKIPVATWKYFIAPRLNTKHTPSLTEIPLKTMSKIPMPRHKYLTKHM